MEDGTRVEWREWGEAAFEEASEREVPVLLSLTATWCRQCHEMDAETYAVPTIGAHVNDGFVPIRVDVDRHPRVRDRYNMGGFPSTVFLTPEGALLTGAGYLAHDGFRQVLERVRTMWAEKGVGAGRTPRVLKQDEPPAGELTADIERQLLGQLTQAYDERAGGWGSSPKFPLPDALEFALKRDREMARRCFDAVRANLFDTYDGGFYRFAHNRDWSDIQYEKCLDSNAALLRAFANAYLYTGEEQYLEPATRTLAYLTTTLWVTEPGAFATSQAPGETESYTLEASDRADADEPPVDETIIAGANALAIDALLTYYAYTDDDHAARYAERALSSLRERLLEDGVVGHFFEPGSVPAETDSSNVSRGESCLLVNQARVLRALVRARSVLGAETHTDATRVADVTIERLRAGRSFVDGPPTGAGLLERPLYPLNTNVELADALLDLAVVTDDPTYETVARDTLEAFAGASDRFGVQVARYASVATRLLEEPLVIRVGAEAGSDLHRAACRVADHEKVVVPDAPGLERNEARAEQGDRHSETVSTPAALSEAVSSL